MNGCETMKCTDYRDGVCHHEGECKYRDEVSVDSNSLLGKVINYIDEQQELLDKMYEDGTGDREVCTHMWNGMESVKNHIEHELLPNKQFTD